MTLKKEKKEAPKAGLSPLAAGVDPLVPAVQAPAPVLTPQEALTYDFAVNIVKLNRAKAWVSQQAALTQTPVPTGAALIQAVKARYEDLGGLIRGQQYAGRSPKNSGARVRNVAPNDRD